MKIVFALIWMVQATSGGDIQVIKIGEFEKYSQCKEQGEKLTNSPDGRRNLYFVPGYYCIPVNATGSK